MRGFPLLKSAGIVGSCGEIHHARDDCIQSLSYATVAAIIRLSRHLLPRKTDWRQSVSACVSLPGNEGGCVARL